MLIRCKHCHGSVQLATEADSDQVSCPTCKQRYTLKLGRGKAARDQLFARARKVALKYEIDLPAAYSVVLGLMTVEQVRSVQGPSRPIRSEASGSIRKYKYDPEFHDAVMQGFLTPYHAFERGKRQAFAERMAARHRLSIDQALAVADGRESLLTALRHQRPGPSVAVSVSRLPRPEVWVSALLAITALAAVASFFLPGLKGRAKDLIAGNEAVAVERNHDGEVVRIEGPDPVSVFKAYCSAMKPKLERKCIGLYRGRQEPSELLLGLQRDLSVSEANIAIYIAHDRTRRSWVAGNGRSPLAAFQAPDGLEAVPEILLSGGDGS